MFIKNENLIVENLENQIVIFNPEQDEFYNLNEIGKIVWDMTSDKPVEEIYSHIYELFEADFDIIKRDVDSLVVMLLNKKLIFEKG